MTQRNLREVATRRPEHRLLLALARTKMSEGQQEALRKLLATAQDWRIVLHAARGHRVAALCYPQLLAAGGCAAPPEILEGFRRQAIATAARNLRLASRLAEVISNAERAGIELVPYKGPVLAEMAYGNLGLREFVDLDFIVPQRQLAETAKVLGELGYRSATPALVEEGSPIPGEYVFLADEGDFQIEVHTEFTLRHFPVPPDLESLMCTLRPVSLAGRPVFTFSREDTLTLLAVHGSKDFWAQLLWICDIVALVREAGFDWDRALAQAGRMRCRRMVNVALLLAGDMLDAPIPASMKRRAEADAVAGEHARWVAERLFAPRPIAPWGQVRYRMRMVEGFWPGMRYATRLATTPGADDWNRVRLPGRLRFAYSLIRPLRLFRGQNS
ncbi:MAG TPA: nucleotidyltransferase family protein [Candidatus Acidoferrales bacterium]|nr:nucleotidyltransferase family protein [Candidatus Acidoferrales bacterium]